MNAYQSHIELAACKWRPSQLDNVIEHDTSTIGAVPLIVNQPLQEVEDERPEVFTGDLLAKDL